jgi:hypothetical protein
VSNLGRARPSLGADYTRMRRATCTLVLAAAAIFAGAAHAGTQVPASTRAVSTLTPAATAKLWRQLAARPQPARRAADCRPLRAVFYTPLDWLRLATKLAANASPCAQYYVSIPPLASDKTKARPDQAWRIRALGPNFHAMAEIHFATWQRWVAANASTFYAAGVEARHRMEAAGFDVTKGDTWAVNEFPSSVRANAGTIRQSVRDFVHGLYAGDGTPPTRGVVFVIGVGQTATGLPLYQSNVQNWMTDSAFWTDMSAYVSDWSQEVYGDVRRFAVPGSLPDQRRDYLVDYLEHIGVLAGVGPPTIDPARAYLAGAYSPLANASWQWASGFGFTAVPVELMQSFVSAQVYAMRYYGATHGLPQDHFGFAWHPQNSQGLTPADFNAQTSAILDRLSAAIRDSGETVDPARPGVGACGPNAQNCAGDLAGATFTEAWKSFRTWTAPALSFTTAPQTIPAGGTSGPMTLALLTNAGTPQIATTPVTVTLSSNSPKGLFSTSSAGPFTPTLTLTIPAGQNAVGPFYYQDTHAGSALLTAASQGITSGTQTETILPGPVVGLSVKPVTATVGAGTPHTLTALGVDSYGNSVPVNAAWSLAPPGLGKLQPASGPTTTFTAAGRAGTGTITASVSTPGGSLTATSRVTVKPGRLTVSSVRYGVAKKAIFVTVTVLDLRRRPVEGAVASIVMRRRGYGYFSGRMGTGVNGRAVFRVPRKKGKGCFRTTVVRVQALGYLVWHGQTPGNRLCA